jgi:hypothetical protein
VTRRPGRFGARLAWLAGVIGVLLLVGGCAGGNEEDGLPQGAGDGGGGGSAGAATTVTEATAVDVDSDERVLEDYRKHWDDVVAAHAANDPFMKRLTNHAVDPRLSTVTLEIRDDKNAGKVTKGEPKLLSAEVTSRGDGRAKVESCLDPATWRYYSSETGKPLEEFGTKRYNVDATLLLKEATWKVALLTIREDSCDG